MRLAAGEFVSTLVQRVHSVLVEAGIQHALIGAAAMVVHGYTRATADMDLLTTSWAVFDPALWDGLRALGVEVEIRRGDDDDPLAGVVLLEQERDVVDIVVGRGAWQTAMVRQAQAGAPVPCVQLPDLVLLKLHAGGVKDRRDIEDLLPLLNETGFAAVEAGLGHLSEWSRSLWRTIVASV